MSNNGTCPVSSIFESAVFPAMSGATFGLMSLAALLGSILVLARKAQLRLWVLRFASMVVMCAALAIHAAIGILDAKNGWIQGGMPTPLYFELQTVLFALSEIGTALVCMLILFQTRKQAVRTLGIFLAISLLLSAVASVACAYAWTGQLARRVALLISLIFGVLTILVSVQAGRRSELKREMAVLTSACAALLILHIGVGVVVIFLLSGQVYRLSFFTNGLFELCAEMLPLCLFLSFFWPRRAVIDNHDGGAKGVLHAAVGGSVERFLRAHALSWSVLLVFYLYCAYTFAANALLTCASEFGQSVGVIATLDVGAAAVLVDAVPLLLFSVMIGWLTWLKTTLFGLAIPFDDHIQWHLHVAGVTGVCTIVHVTNALLIGFSSFDYLPWPTGFVALASCIIAIGVGLVYWCLPSRPLSFPRFIWLHRVGYIMICVAIPIHVWPSLKENPQTFIIYYIVLFLWIVELVWRSFHLARSSECRMREISADFFWLEVSVEPRAQYAPGQWVYLTVPALGLLERHPFTIAGRFLNRADQLSHFTDDESSALLEENSNEQQQQQLQPMTFTKTNIRFLIKKCSGRGEHSWTARLLNKLRKRQALSIYVDGPFSSPAMNITQPSVSRAVLIGLGSGITAPLGIAAGLHSWCVLVGVSREPSMVCQVVCAIKSIKNSDAACLSGGAILYLTQAPGFSWPDEELQALLARVAAGTSTRYQLQAQYEVFVELARAAFGPKSFPILDVEAGDLRAYGTLLEEWRRTHDFQRPCEGVEVRIGRPFWGELLQELQSGPGVDAIPRSNIPLSYEPIPLNLGHETYIRDIHLLYTGGNGPLADINKFVAANNQALYRGAKTSHYIVHSETW